MKDDVQSDFIKHLYESGEVKDVSEAFEKYPVEEEWHKGKVENILKEPKEVYSIYNVGDIVFVKNYCYADGTIGFNHLFVIIEQDNIAIPIENFGMIISSKIDKLSYTHNMLLLKNKQNGLNQDSIVKTDEIYKISTTQILFKIGEVDEQKIKEYKEAYYSLKNSKKV